MNKNQFEARTEKLYTSDTHASPEFQCDQTGGFPCSLCVNWDEGKAWLALNYSLSNPDDDVSEYEQMCADYGIRECTDTEQFNELLRNLGADAYHSAYIPPDEDEGMVQKW